MAKKLFGGVRTQLVGTLVAAIGGLALTACNNSRCGTGPLIYKKPCCAQSGGSMSCGAKCGAAPQAAPAAPRPAAPQMACGAGKCA